MEIRNFWSDETPGPNRLIVTISNDSVPIEKQIMESPLFEETVEQDLKLNNQKTTVNVSEINSSIKAGILQKTEEFDINCL